MARNTRIFGSNEPLNIFQDDLFDAGLPMTSHAPMPTSSKPARAPLGSAKSNVILNPPSSSSGVSFSPYKSKSSPRSPLKSSNAKKLKAVSMAPPRGQMAATDSLEKRPFLSQFKTSSQKPTMSVHLDFGKENVHPQSGATSTIDMNFESFKNSNGKRGLMDAAPIAESRPIKKSKTTAPEEPQIPSPGSFAPIVDDGTKPPHSYATLIAMAILRSPMRRLTLSQIYRWIQTTYAFYTPNDTGWQNSIRHNLSLNKAFIKTERPKDDPGKGNYWTIQPGSELHFLKEKTTRKSASASENLPVMSSRLEPSGQTSAPAQEPTLPPPGPASYATLPPLPTSQATMSMPAEPSSDATIPVSDNAAPEESGDQTAQKEMTLDSSLFSSLPTAIHSSPPVPRRRASHSRTPPSAQNPGSSAVRPQRRKFAPMDDSGYISSLESSVMRPNTSNPKINLLTSEADRPRSKRGRGRAEEEIARLRNSSPFSPTKARYQPGYNPVSSSPLRQAHDNPMLHPGTPNALLMRPPAMPPASVSPNTNLRLHRNNVSNMLRTPVREIAGLNEDQPWSPAFHLDDTNFIYEQGFIDVSGFDVFEEFTNLDDKDLASVSNAEAGSPVKRSSRPHPTRTSSTSALGESSSLANLSSRKAAGMADFLKLPTAGLMSANETPSKVFEGMSSPSKALAQSPCKATGSFELPGDGDWSNLVFDPNEFLAKTSHPSSDMEEFGGLDMLQGFQRIGAGPQQPKSSKASKPQLERSFTTHF